MNSKLSSFILVAMPALLVIVPVAAVQFYDGQTNVTLQVSPNTRCVLTSADGKQMFTASVTLFYGLVDQTFYPLNLTFGVRNVWTVPVNIVSFAVTGTPTYLTVANNMSAVSAGTPIALQPGAYAHVNILASFASATAVTSNTSVPLHLAVNCA
jgi:hypothetical protein